MSRFSEKLWPFKVEIEQSADSETTRKWLFRAEDGAAIETVLMGYPRRATFCISTRRAVPWRAHSVRPDSSGSSGTSQRVRSSPRSRMRSVPPSDGMPGVPDHLTNVVFMGMGEPLANYDRVSERHCAG